VQQPTKGTTIDNMYGVIFLTAAVIHTSDHKLFILSFRCVQTVHISNKDPDVSQKGGSSYFQGTWHCAHWMKSVFQSVWLQY